MTTPMQQQAYLDQQREQLESQRRLIRSIEAPPKIVQYTPYSQRAQTEQALRAAKADIQQAELGISQSQEQMDQSAAAQQAYNKEVEEWKQAEVYIKNPYAPVADLPAGVAHKVREIYQSAPADVNLSDYSKKLEMQDYKYNLKSLQDKGIEPIYDKNGFIVGFNDVIAGAEFSVKDYSKYMESIAPTVYSQDILPKYLPTPMENNIAFTSIKPGSLGPQMTKQEIESLQGYADTSIMKLLDVPASWLSDKAGIVASYGGKVAGRASDYLTEFIYDVRQSPLNYSPFGNAPMFETNIEGAAEAMQKGRQRDIYFKPSGIYLKSRSKEQVKEDTRSVIEPLGALITYGALYSIPYVGQTLIGSNIIHYTYVLGYDPKIPEKVTFQEIIPDKRPEGVDDATWNKYLDAVKYANMINKGRVYDYNKALDDAKKSLSTSKSSAALGLGLTALYLGLPYLNPLPLGSSEKNLINTKYGVTKGELRELERLSSEGLQDSVRASEIRLKAMKFLSGEGDFIKNKELLQEFINKYPQPIMKLPSGFIPSLGVVVPNKNLKFFESDPEDYLVSKDTFSGLVSKEGRLQQLSSQMELLDIQAAKNVRAMNTNFDSWFGTKTVGIPTVESSLFGTSGMSGVPEGGVTKTLTMGTKVRSTSIQKEFRDQAVEELKKMGIEFVNTGVPGNIKAKSVVDWLKSSTVSEGTTQLKTQLSKYNQDVFPGLGVGAEIGTKTFTQTVKTAAGTISKGFVFTVDPVSGKLINPLEFISIGKGDKSAIYLGEVGGLRSQSIAIPGLETPLTLEYESVKTLPSQFVRTPQGKISGTEITLPGGLTITYDPTRKVFVRTYLPEYYLGNKVESKLIPRYEFEDILTSTPKNVKIPSGVRLEKQYVKEEMRLGNVQRGEITVPGINDAKVKVKFATYKSKGEVESYFFGEETGSFTLGQRPTSTTKTSSTKSTKTSTKFIETEVGDQFTLTVDKQTSIPNIIKEAPVIATPKTVAKISTAAVSAPTVSKSSDIITDLLVGTTQASRVRGREESKYGMSTVETPRLTDFTNVLNPPIENVGTKEKDLTKDATKEKQQEKSAQAQSYTQNLFIPTFFDIPMAPSVVERVTPQRPRIAIREPATPRPDLFFTLLPLPERERKYRFTSTKKKKKGNKTYQLRPTAAQTAWDIGLIGIPLSKTTGFELLR